MKNFDWKKAAAGYRLPVAALLALLGLLACTSPVDLTPHYRTTPEVFAHELGHSINSVWVGLSLLALVVPSLWNCWKQGQRPIWAWRALDAILLDFLCVDAMGKDLWTGLGRPNHPDEAGFPSGHSTMAFLMAWLIWRRYPRLGLLWFCIATLIAWSRAEVHAHYPYQIVFGALLGMALGTLITQRRAGVLLPHLLLSDNATRRVLASENS